MNLVQRTIIGLILASALIVQVLVPVVARFALADFYIATASSPLFVSTALAISVLALRRDDVVRPLLLGAVLSAALMAVLALSGRSPDTAWTPAILGFWCSAILVSGYRIATTRGAERLSELDGGLVIAALPLMVPVTFVGLELTAQIADRTYDNYFYAFDGLLPIPAARLIAEFCANHPWAWSVSGIIYYDFLLVLSAFVVFPWRHDRSVSGQILSRWVIATLIGYGLYYWLPGVGPGVAFYGTPAPHFDSLPSPYQVELTWRSGFEGQPRNAMPSLHATWAFLIALMSLRMAPWVRVFGIVYGAATVIVTLGLREHYLIDLVVAVPLAVAVHAGAGLLEQKERISARLLAALGGGAMTVAWLLVIRYGTAPLQNVSEVASMLVLATLAASVWLVFRSETSNADVVVRRSGYVRAGLSH